MNKKVMTAEVKTAILANLEAGQSIAGACKACGVNRTSEWKERKLDKKYGQAVDKAKEYQIDTVEDALYVSAVSGNTTAQIFYLINRSGGKWKNTNHLNVNHGGEIKNVVKIKIMGKGKQDATRTGRADD